MTSEREIKMFRRDIAKRGFNAILTKWGSKKTRELLTELKTQGDECFNTYLTILERDIVGQSMKHGHMSDARAIIEKHIGAESVNESDDVIDVMELEQE